MGAVLLAGIAIFLASGNGGFSSVANAADIDFYAGGPSTLWNVGANWVGGSVPGTGDKAIIDYGGDVDLNTNPPVRDIFVGQHSNLNLHDYYLRVTNDTVVEHDATPGPIPELTLDDSGILKTEDLRLFGGNLRNDGGTVIVTDYMEIRETPSTIDLGVGSLIGHGSMVIEGNFVNDGKIIAGNGGTLTFSGSSTTTYNLDGQGSNDGKAEVYALSGNIEFTNGSIKDSFDGKMAVGYSNSNNRRYISFHMPWRLASAGELTLRGDADNLYSQRAEITGNGWMDVAGTIDAYHYTRIDTGITFEAGSQVNIPDEDGSFRIAQDKQVVYEGGTFTGEGTYYQNSDAAVQPMATVNVEVDTFDFDGTTDGKSFTLFGNFNITGKRLKDAYDGDITMYDDGVLNVSMVDQLSIIGPGGVVSTVDYDRAWNMDGTLTFQSASGANIAGTSKMIVGGTVRVDDGWAQINAPTRFESGSTLRVDADEYLVLYGDSEFKSGSTQVVWGTLRIDPDVTFEGNSYLYGGTLEVLDFTNEGQLTSGVSASLIHGQATFANGSTNILNRDLHIQGKAIIEAGATFSGSSTLVINDGSDLQLLHGAVVGVDILVDGKLIPGNTPGSARVQSLTLSDSSESEFEFGGHAVGSEYDHVEVDNQLSIDGEIDLQLIDGFAPSLGDTFTIMEAASSTGIFDRVNMPAMSSGLGLAVNYDGTTVDVRASLLGDADQDDDVDTTDATIALTSYSGASGAGRIWNDGDFDGDGDVDTQDLTTIIANFTGASADDATAVPDLIYDPATGNVTIDANGSDMISFAVQGGPFNSADFSALPGGLTDNIEGQIGWTSADLFAGVTGSADLGQILPAGLSVAAARAMLSTAHYGLALANGGGGGHFNVVIPEPASALLLMLGLAMVHRRSKHVK